MTDKQNIPLYVGMTKGKLGFADRYNGSSFIDAAMDGTGKSIYFAEVPAELCSEVEAELIRRAKLANPNIRLFNKSKLHWPKSALTIKEEGKDKPHLD